MEGALPQITLSPETFHQLHKLCGEKLTDFDGVIVGLLADHAALKNAAPKVYTNGLAPNLTGTTLREAEIGGRPLQKVDWQSLMIEAISQAAEKIGTGADFKKLVTIKTKPGDQKQNGWYFVPAANVTIQGQNTNAVLKTTERIAKALKLPVKAEFAWGAKSDKAGERETLTININAE